MAGHLIAQLPALAPGPQVVVAAGKTSLRASLLGDVEPRHVEHLLHAAGEGFELATTDWPSWIWAVPRTLLSRQQRRS